MWLIFESGSYSFIVLCVRILFEGGCYSGCGFYWNKYGMCIHPCLHSIKFIITLVNIMKVSMSHEGHDLHPLHSLLNEVSGVSCGPHSKPLSQSSSNRREWGWKWKRCWKLNSPCFRTQDVGWKQSNRTTCTPTQPHVLPDFQSGPPTIFTWIHNHIPVLTNAHFMSLKAIGNIIHNSCNLIYSK